MSGPGDRRSFMRRALTGAVEQVARATEGKIVQHYPVRPPGAGPEMAFLAACTRCGLCAPVCPPQAITYLGPRAGLAAGTPKLDPAKVPCAVCVDMPCAAACPSGALVVPADGWRRARLGRVAFHPERCITFQGEACDVCARACPVGEVALAIDGGGHPVLKLDGCVACGACVRECVSSPSSFTFHALER